MPIRTISLSVITGKAWQQMIELLFRPFKLSCWLRLILIAWLAGFLSAGGSQWNVSPPGGSEDYSSSQQTRTWDPAQPIPQDNATRVRAWFNQLVHEGLPFLKREFQSKAPSFWQQFKLWIILGVLGIVTCWLLWLWLQARMSFVFVHVMLEKHVRIRKPFRDYAAQANAYFIFLIILSLLSLAVFVGELVWIGVRGLEWLFVLLRQPDIPAYVAAHWLAWLKQSMGVLLVLFLIGLVGSIVYLWARHFIVPIMYWKKCSAATAWATYARIIRLSPWEACKYLLWQVGLSFLASIAFGMITLVLGLAILFIGGIVFLIGALLLKLIAMPQMVMIALLVIALIPISIFLMVVFTSVWLPYGVWIRLLSLEYLCSLQIQNRTGNT